MESRHSDIVTEGSLTSPNQVEAFWRTVAESSASKCGMAIRDEERSTLVTRLRRQRSKTYSRRAKPRCAKIGDSAVTVFAHQVGRL